MPIIRPAGAHLYTKNGQTLGRAPAGLLGAYHDDEDEDESGPTDGSAPQSIAAESEWCAWGAWERCHDPASSAYYFWNTETNEVRWTAPEPPPAASVAAAQPEAAEPERTTPAADTTASAAGIAAAGDTAAAGSSLEPEPALAPVASAAASSGGSFESCSWE
ncbi:hypothetical protein EMIHUDRAFT_224677 [Emiliania huxleyi CCMP1516]|uniref:WW domain-containing protein n=2 Tax=Emiliania huxleyi TaxID=2903 RepID=A0A0D3KRB8_EMIH1|nr:hypothetical protein EMIHUDRAFT_224677 [Emiliania huxleyi CCMP1516]EOD38303.1 hypothetical protein EMIHUDRAFT_224677 [Emiliania huxleyi CCMP1516]|eukprot:XP_005790732.1 hypothetical protein EMIHUDRAFT_224677 [Emiliania huxleyi CCMP1516]